MRARFLVIFFCFYETLTLASDDPLANLKKGQPKEVIEVIDRLVGCKHWSGEAPYDAERGREISTAMADLKCGELKKDEAALRVRYAKNPSALKVLQQAKQTSY